MKLIFVLQHFIGGESVEQVASFDFDKLKARAKEIEDEHAENYETMEDGSLDDEVWEKPVPPNPEDLDILYYSYDQYIRNECFDDENEIVITRMKFID